MASPTSPGSGGGRGAAGHLAPERRAGGEQRPRCRLPHEGGEGVGHVLGDGGPVAARRRRRRPPPPTCRRRPPAGRGGHRAQGVHRRAPTSPPSRAAAPSSSSVTRGRPGSARTAMTRDAPSVRGPVGIRRAGPPAPGSVPAVKAPRRPSSRTASSTCSRPAALQDERGRGRAPSSASRRPRVGLPALPPGPRARAGRRPSA